MQIGLTKAEPQHLEVILPLVAAFHKEEGVDQATETREAAVQTLLNNPAFGEIWMIESGDELAGYVTFAFGYSIEFNGRDAFIDEIYIAPDHRGAGLGTAALSRLKNALRESGIKAAHLEVEVDNTKAQALYARQGFQMRRNYHLMSARLD